MKPIKITIPFNRPAVSGKEKAYLNECIKNYKFSGDGPFTKKATAELQKILGAKNILLTTSCTDALEMCAILLDIKAGDEVIMPSYTFVSTANAFVLRGAKIVFVDVEPVTMNLDPECVRRAITKNTKAIVVVHYAGISCDMDEIMKIREEFKVAVIEDAAQALLSTYKGKLLGTFGDFACFSFHETKNIHCGEGGALVVNSPAYFERAEIIREKGTNRSKFYRGQTDKYTWMDIGSSFLLNDVSSAFLLAQLQSAKKITANRLEIWRNYYRGIYRKKLPKGVELPAIPTFAKQNGHIFYLKFANEPQRAAYISHMRANGINAVFHYVPLHSAPAGLQYSTFSGKDLHTTLESERLVRLPLYYKMSKSDQSRVISVTNNFINKID